MKDVLIVEPFCGGSHGQLVQLLSSDDEIQPRCEVYSLPAKKWHWRARTSSLSFSQTIQESPDFRVLFTSSVLNLAELVALRPDLSTLKKILYFHENQLVYPVRKHQDRDFQYGYNQILSCLVADVVCFNSSFNMESFLSSIASFLKLIPDHRPKNLASIIRPKCRVLYFPLKDIGGSQELIRSNISDIHSTLFCDSPRSNPEICQLQATTFECSFLSGASINLDDENKKVQKKYSEVQKKYSSLSPNCAKDQLVKMPDISVNYNNDQGHASKIRPAGSSGSQILISNQKADSPIDDKKFDRNSTSLPPAMPAGSLSAQGGAFLRWEQTAFLEENRDCLHIVWPHRWEHDKDPGSFFASLFELQKEGLEFYVSVVGETYSEVPDMFATARQRLGTRVKAWGFQTRQDYLSVLDAAHVVVSTALHEFFGVSMLEAVSRNCYPLCPNRLVYPEIYPKECLYSTQTQLVKRLKRFCQKPQCVNASFCKDLAEKFSWTKLQKDYRELILC